MPCILKFPLHTHPSKQSSKRINCCTGKLTEEAHYFHQRSTILRRFKSISLFVSQSPHLKVAVVRTPFPVLRSINWSVTCKMLRISSTGWCQKCLVTYFIFAKISLNSTVVCIFIPLWKVDGSVGLCVYVVPGCWIQGSAQTEQLLGSNFLPLPKSLIGLGHNSPW